LRCRQNNMAQSTAIKTTNPPTTPPAIAPTFVFFEELLGVGDAVAGRARVAALVGKDALMP
jgi:hypothetical protein